jgi:hypothetical protein
MRLLGEVIPSPFLLYCKLVSSLPNFYFPISSFISSFKP